jgi:hypothetical protein
MTSDPRSSVGHEPISSLRKKLQLRKTMDFGLQKARVSPMTPLFSPYIGSRGIPAIVLSAVESCPADCRISYGGGDPRESPFFHGKMMNFWSQTARISGDLAILTVPWYAECTSCCPLCDGVLSGCLLDLLRRW